MSSSRQLAERIERFRKAIGTWHDRQAARQGTTPARARLLLILTTHGPSKMNELSRLLEVTPRNVTKLVDRLEQDGLAARSPHPNDRRATLISATPQGRAFMEEADEGWDGLEVVLDRLDLQEQAELQRLLEKLLSFLDDGR